jgi:hypothetical protein
MISAASPTVPIPGFLAKAAFFVIALALLCSAAASAAENAFFPIMIKDRVLLIQAASEYASLSATLREVLAPEQPSVATPERLQYDVIAVPGEGPVTLTFDFDARGKLTGVGIESMLKQQNPVAVALVAWLEQNAAPGVGKGKTATWKHAGFVFRFKDVKDAGEDSYYGVAVSRK